MFCLIHNLLVNLCFSFTCEDEITSVAQYYRKKYKIDLKYVAWPAIQAGNDSKPVYLPMEVLLHSNS